MPIWHRPVQQQLETAQVRTTVFEGSAGAVTGAMGHFSEDFWHSKHAYSRHHYVCTWIKERSTVISGLRRRDRAEDFLPQRLNGTDLQCLVSCVNIYDSLISYDGGKNESVMKVRRGDNCALICTENLIMVTDSKWPNSQTYVVKWKGTGQTPFIKIKWRDCN